MEYKEELAELEHEQWSHWTKYFLQWQNPDRRHKWDIQCKTKYKDLSEKEKESDRKWADKIQAINSIRIFEYVNKKDKTSFDLFQLFADLTGFKIEEFNKKLKIKSSTLLRDR